MPKPKGESPSPHDIRNARLALNLTQAMAASLVHATGRQWCSWENGHAAMHPAYWHLFRLKHGKPALPVTCPEPGRIRRARLSAGLTRREAAALIGCSSRSWEEWERGTRNMPCGFWELFLLLAARSDRDIS